MKSSITHRSLWAAVPFALLSLAAAAAAAAADDADYSPKFAREEQHAEVLSFDSCAKPEWPRQSLRNEETGTVTLRFTVGPNGRLIRYEVLRSSGFPMLDQAAGAGMSKCKFRPASINGKPVQSIAAVQYVWTLE